MVEKSDVDGRQIAAIMASIDLGRILQEDLGGDLRSFYTSEGGSLDSAVEHFGIERAYQCGREISRKAVYLALRGHDGSFEREPYEGLISESERTALVFEKKSAAGIRNGSKLKEQGRGIFAQTDKERRELGLRAHEEGFGAHALTHEEHRQAGKTSVLSRGHRPWDDEAKKRAYELSQMSEFQRPSGPYMGKPNCEMIRQRLVEEFPNSDIGNANRVRMGIWKYKKYLQKQSDLAE